MMTTNPDEPIVLTLSEDFERETLRIEIVPAVIDKEEDLLDEQSPPKVQEFKDSIVAAYDGAHPDDAERTYGATFELSGRTLTISPEKTLAYSVPYLLLIEPGLEDLEGHATVPRLRLPFTYRLPGGGPNSLPSGYFYFLMNVEYAAVQIPVFAYLEVDPDSGAWRGIFTKAIRRPELNSRPGCPSCSGDTPVCSLYPGPPACVKPSLKQGDLSEFKDRLPEPDLPNGFTFIADGFVRDEPDGSIALGTAPFLIDIVIGAGGIEVRAEGTKINGTFVKDPNDSERWIANGSISVDVIKLNGAGADPTKGTLTAMNLKQSEVDEIESFGFPIPTDLAESSQRARTSRSNGCPWRSRRATMRSASRALCSASTTAARVVQGLSSRLKSTSPDSIPRRSRRESSRMPSKATPTTCSARTRGESLMPLISSPPRSNSGLIIARSME